MSEFDMQLARGVDDGYTNLAIGEPYVIQQSLDLGIPVAASSDEHMFYPPAAGDHILVEQLQKRYPKKHVVVTNGAKQALYASIYALQRTERFARVTAEAPFWPSFPTIAEHSGMEFRNARPGTTASLSIITCPNNPNGIVKISNNSCHIWDAAYAHPVFGYRQEFQPDHHIKVESASKTFGLSGYRVGWLITSDDEVALNAAKYVELHTSGVSVPAQRRVAEVLSLDGVGAYDEGFHNARMKMIDNGQEFIHEMHRFVDDVQGVPYNNTGMFAWFQVRPSYHERFVRALEAAKIHLITGLACGWVVSDGYWYRMSMGYHPAGTREALARLHSEIVNA